MDILILKAVALAAAAMVVLAAGVTAHLAVSAANRGNWAQYWALLIPDLGLIALGVGIAMFGYYL